MTNLKMTSWQNSDSLCSQVVDLCLSGWSHLSELSLPVGELLVNY